MNSSRRYPLAGLASALLLLLCVGCQSGTQLMPTPNLYAQGGVDPFPDVPPALQHNRVEVLYMTDRKPEGTLPDDPKYGFHRSRSVAFGISQVEFGKDVSWDQLVAASRASKRQVDLPVRIVSTKELIRFPETPKILAELPPLQPTSQLGPGATTLKAEVDQDLHLAHEELSRRLALTPDKQVFIFVHGYDNTFDDSIETIAELWHFLGRRGVPVAYSWPAGGKGLLRGYEYDSQSSQFTIFHLKETIRRIARCQDVDKINVICNSRGTAVVVNTLAELHMEISGSGRSTREVLKLGRVVLAAPDIDLDVMIQRAVTVRLGLVPEQTTIYVCAKDEALSISNWLSAGMTRFGAVRSGMFTPEELNMLRHSRSVALVDCQISDPGPYGHSYFHANPAVSSDLILMMRYGRMPGPEHGRPMKIQESGFPTTSPTGSTDARASGNN